MTAPPPVVLPDVSVMYVESATGLAGASGAFDRLEARLPSLRGRKFYGTFQPPAGPYRACVAIEPGDDATALGLQTWTIPGGKCSRRKLMDWESRIPEIGTSFRQMAEECEPDAGRPSIEFYRSQKELLLFLPVK
ncbi:MAG: hypothetical protein ACRELS_15455 [Candidatus Rokuibacteriota bacterium]